MMSNMRGKLRIAFSATRLIAYGVLIVLSVVILYMMHWTLLFQEFCRFWKLA